MNSVAIRERPILFSGPMVRAILDGRKTQTRRVIKPQPECIDHDVWKLGEKILTGDEMREHLFHEVYGTKGTPYGSMWSEGGDRLWVRETFRETFDIDGRPVMEYRAGGTRLIVGESIQHGEHRATSVLPKWKPSIFLKRWMCRIELEITDMRVERLREITEQDAIAEGAQCAGFPAAMTNTVAFRQLWTSINGADSWMANPWVWAITFKRANQ